jgi:uncharacterized protein YodC (DUF2158 family)
MGTLIKNLLYLRGKRKEFSTFGQNTIPMETKNTDLWGRYWIKGGLEVVHRNDVTAINVDRISLFKMTVEKVIKRSKEGQGGQRKTFIEGVKCHWIDGQRKFQVGQFHTNELVPYEVAVKGLEEVNYIPYCRDELDGIPRELLLQFYEQAKPQNRKNLAFLPGKTNGY